MTTRLWAIGDPTHFSADLLDTYRDPAGLDPVTWRVGVVGQHWPAFHPSEADPDAGYCLHPYTIAFHLDAPPPAARLRVHYVVSTPRLGWLEVQVNGVPLAVYPRPAPSELDQGWLIAGLHSTLNADGVMELLIPGALLRAGDNRLVLTCHDGQPFARFDNIEKIRRLDRIATAAGLTYRALELDALPVAAANPIADVALIPSVVYERGADGALLERGALHIEFAQATPALDWTLDLADGQRREQVVFQTGPIAGGHLRHALHLFDGDGPLRYRLQCVIDGQPWSVEGEVQRRRKWTVYVTPHAHTDIGYTHRQAEVAERLSRNLDVALDLITDRPAGAAAYHLDASWTLEGYLQTRSRERIAQLAEAVQADQVGVPGNYTILLSHLAALEDLIRNHVFSAEALAAWRRQPRFDAVVDVPSLTSALPDILHGAGIRWLALAANQDRGPSRLSSRLHRRSPFWWRGPAGGSVLVWWAKMYCELRKVCGSPPDLGAAERGLNLWLDEYERAAYPLDSVLLYGQEADNTDLDPQPIDFVAEWNAAYAYPRLVLSNVETFFEAVEAAAPTLPTLCGDGGAYWEDGVLSSLDATLRARRAQAMLPAAERLAALAVAHQPGLAYPQADFDAAWQQLLLYDEHTWGAFLSGIDPDALLQRDQWAAKEGMARDAERRATDLLHAAVTRHTLALATEGREVVVINPHSWTVSGVALAEIGRHERVLDTNGAPVPARVVRTLDTLQWVELWVEALPGLGYRRYRLEERRPDDHRPPTTDHGENTLSASPLPLGEGRGEGLSADYRPPTTDHGENTLSAPPLPLGEGRGEGLGPPSARQDPHPNPTPPSPRRRGEPEGGEGTRGERAYLILANNHVRLVIDPQRGCVVSWTDMALGRELVDADAPWGFGQFVYVTGGEGTRLVSNRATWPDGRADEHTDFKLVDVRRDESAWGSSLTLVGDTPAGRLSIEWRLGPDRAVDVAYTLDKVETRAKEAGYVAFPLALPDAAVLSDSHLGWVDWQRDRLPGACLEWLPLQTGILVSGAEAVVHLASPDIPLFCVGDRVQGRWPSQADVRGGRILSYVFNNYWSTNYKPSQGGRLTFRYRLTADTRIDPARAYRLGWQARLPLYAHRISLQEFRAPKAQDPHPNPLPEGEGTRLGLPQGEGSRLAQVTPDEVVISTLKGARAGDGLVVRLQETGGAARQATLRLPGQRIVQAQLTNLLERPLADLPVADDGVLRVDVPAWGLTTVRIATTQQD